MLSNHAKLLLSAYVDGALSGQDRAAAERLVRESAEARRLVNKLNDNILKLQKLPPRSLGGEFPNLVLSRLPAAPKSAPIAAAMPPILAQPLHPFGEGVTAPAPNARIVKKPHLRRGMPAWAVGAIALSVVGGIAVGGAFWLRFQVDNESALLPKGGKHTPMIVKHEPPNIDEPKLPNPVDQLIANVVKGSGERYGDAKVEPVVSNKAQPVRFAFNDLQGQKSLDSLRWELAQSSGAPTGVHLEVTVTYNARSLSRIIESFHKYGVRLVVTPPAEASLAKNQPVLIYAENLQPEQIALALRELSEADTTGTGTVASTFDAVRISPGTADDLLRIAQGLGIDPKQLKSPGTAVTKVAPVGVVLPAERLSNPAAISEIRGFLAGRGPVQIGALHVFLHLQPAGK
jgi:hypothetical protein